MLTKTFSVIIGLSLLLSACASAAGVSQPAPAALPTPGTDSAGAESPAAGAARGALARQLKVGIDDIRVAGVEAVDWPDACLGMTIPGEMCAQVITPGYRVRLVYETGQYEFHTNADGSAVRQAGGPATTGSGAGEARPLLSWEGMDCSKLVATAEGLSYGHCDAAVLSAAQLSNAGLDTRVQGWVATFASFEAVTPAGKVSFNGQGKTIASAAEQRMMAEWATLQYMVVSSGRAGAAWQMAFGYARNGGIGGFCDNVEAYRDGLVRTSNCKGFNATLYLTASELELLYGWLDSLATIDYQHSDPASADGMSIVLAFAGQGQKQADEATVRGIVEFAEALMARAMFTSQAPAETRDAEKALTGFLTALNAGDYPLAAKLYGGDTSELRSWNPDIQGDLSAWLERGCMQNGLRCLAPRSVTYCGPDVRGGYQFTVELDNPDGTLFRRGPCCGEATGPRQSRFFFEVLKNGQGWQVMELPPYVP
jgi:hypothetical protein